MKTLENNKNYLEIDIEKGIGIMNYRTNKIQGFVCEIAFNCTCGWNGFGFGEYAKGNYSKTCPQCGAKSKYTI